MSTAPRRGDPTEVASLLISGINRQGGDLRSPVDILERECGSQPNFGLPRSDLRINGILGTDAYLHYNSFLRNKEVWIDLCCKYATLIDWCSTFQILKFRL